MSRTTRSTLVDHRFPAFYACYLLKSIRTPRSTATYIGSTPSPPRRIRQHNGLISQGAWKTKDNRPWVMQMIVHGFPSKLAALQFEWAWQNPQISRHLRDDDGKAFFNQSGKLRRLKPIIQVARSMVSSHPYHTWPLYVTFFTEEAEKAWCSAGTAAGMPLLPPGLKVVTELEGVDGKSGQPGSGRTGPIDVMDGLFTKEHLRKASEVFLPGSPLRCSICHGSVQHDMDALSVSLCPTSACTAVSHLSCLSRHFLQAENSSSSSSIIPRGGTCGSCHSYVLWGDVIRGCYRRRKGAATPDAELEDEGDREEDMEALVGGEFEEEGVNARPSRSRKPRAQPRSGKRSRARLNPGPSKSAAYSTLATHASNGEREHFDLDVISSSSSDEQESSDDGRPQWHQPHLRANPFGRPTSSQRVNLSTPLPSGALSNSAVGSASEADGRPRAVAADAAGRVSGRERFREEELPSGVQQMSRKPCSVGAHPVDLSGVSGGPAKHNPQSLPDALGGLATGAQGQDEIRGERIPGTPQSRPFPDIPPLSLPHRPMSIRGRQMVALDNEVLEISD